MSVVNDVEWMALLNRANFRCLHCGSVEGLQPAHYHEASRAKGGARGLDDFLVLCHKCHRKYDGEGKLRVRRIDGRFYFKVL